MLGGISDVLTIGFDMAGDDKACLTVMRKINPRKYQVINQIFDKDAEEIYERLAGLTERKAKKIIYLGAGLGFKCPYCNNDRIWKDGNYCKDCGNRLDWSDEE